MPRDMSATEAYKELCDEFNKTRPELLATIQKQHDALISGVPENYGEENAEIWLIVLSLRLASDAEKNDG